MGESVEVLLGEGVRPAPGPTVHWAVWLWLRVHGPQWPAGHYSPNGQDLPHHDPGPVHAPRGSPGRPGWDGKDRDSEGSGKGHGTALCGDQLRRGHGLQGREWMHIQAVCTYVYICKCTCTCTCTCTLTGIVLHIAIVYSDLMPTLLVHCM